MKKELKKTFVSSLDLNAEEIQLILNEKIQEENEYVIKNVTEEDVIFEQKILKNLKYKENKIDIVSLFSGAGGLDLGVELAGLSVKYGKDKAYEFIKDKYTYEKIREDSLVNFLYSNDIFESSNQTYKANFPNTVAKIEKDIKKIAKFPKSDLMLGGFPCPGFSSAGPRLLDDPRNFLYIHYIRALIQSQPAFFIAENVKGLLTIGKGEALKQIKEDFESAGYDVSVNLVNSRDYGVPQLRERVFIIGVRNDIQKKYGFKYVLPSPTHDGKTKPFVTLKEAIGDLPLETADVFESSYSSIYMSRNRKKSWEDQSFTIQASGRQAPMHPHGLPMKKISKDNWTFEGDFNRRLSVRECARIQTFPDWFEFSEGKKDNVSLSHKLNEQYKQIGNAVPVYLAEKISRPIIEFMSKNMF